MRTLALTLWLVAAAAFAADLEIPAEVPAEAGEWVVLAPKTDCKSVVYVPLDGLKPFPSGELKDGRKLIVQAHQAGRYRFVAVGTLKDEQVSRSFTVVVGGVPPPTPVPPGPNPPVPPPTPPGPVVPAKLYLVIVEETADAVAARGKLFTDATLAARVKEKGHRWRVVDKDVKNAEGQVPADVRPYIERAAGKGYPQLYLVDDKGRLLHEGPLPADAAGVLAAVQKAGG